MSISEALFSGDLCYMKTSQFICIVYISWLVTMRYEFLLKGVSERSFALLLTDTRTSYMK